MPPSTEINAYPLQVNSPILQNALTILTPYLPTSLPLYNRLKFGRLFPSAVLLTNLDISNSPTLPGEWLLAFVDRSVRPETEVWMFGNWEASNTPSANTAIQDGLLTNFAKAVKALPLPESIHTTPAQQRQSGEEKDHTGTSRSDYAAHARDPNVVLCGAVHQVTAQILQRNRLVSEAFSTSLVPNHTYVFSLDEGAARAISTDLPSGLRYGELQYKHLEIVRARTHIPRQIATLAALPSVAVFPDSAADDDADPIAWAFVGLDGSLTSLHVEPDWRGRGLAKAVTMKLFRDKMQFLHAEGLRRQAFGFVIHGNVASCRVCESLGGKAEWDAFWVRMDLGNVGS